MEVMVCCTLKTTITTDKQHLSRSLSVEPPNCSSSHNRSLRLGQIFPLFLQGKFFCISASVGPFISSTKVMTRKCSLTTREGKIKVEDIHVLFLLTSRQE